MIRPWRVLSSATTFQDEFITLRTDRCENADGREIYPYHVLEYPEWVGVVPITPAGEVVLAREYRHGAGEIVLGLPSGTVEPRDGGAEAAARRELLEETGYAGDHFARLGRLYSNAARHNNRITSFLAWNVRLVAGQNLDENEEIEVVTQEFAACLRLARRGEGIVQASHLCTLFLAASFILAESPPELSHLRRELERELLRPS